MELERRDDAEVPAAAAQRPEQVVVLGLARDEPAVRGDDLGREQVVTREPDAARQVADAAAERQPADAGRRHDAAGRRQAVGVRGVVEHAPGRAALGASLLCVGIDLHVRHAGQVDHDRVVGGAEARNAVAAPAHGEIEPVFACEVHGRDHVAADVQRTTTRGRRSNMAL